VLIAVSVPLSLHTKAIFVPVFNGLNFSEWKEQVEFHLGVLDLDLALSEEKPAAITDASSNEEKTHYKAWEKSNRQSLKFMRMSIDPQNVEIKEVRVQVPLTRASTSTIVVPCAQTHNDQVQQQVNDPESDNEPIVEQPQEIVFRRSQRERRSAILDDYVVYLQELENDLGIDKDPVSFSEAINGNNSDKWLNAMKEELKSMEQNCVWDLVELPEGCKRVGCKWVFKTKLDSWQYRTL
jgi:hypothetical protein